MPTKKPVIATSWIITNPFVTGMHAQPKVRGVFTSETQAREAIPSHSPGLRAIPVAPARYATRPYRVGDVVLLNGHGEEATASAPRLVGSGDLKDQENVECRYFGFRHEARSLGRASGKRQPSDWPEREDAYVRARLEGTFPEDAFRRVMEMRPAKRKRSTVAAENNAQAKVWRDEARARGLTAAQQGTYVAARSAKYTSSDAFELIERETRASKLKQPEYQRPSLRKDPEKERDALAARLVGVYDEAHKLGIELEPVEAHRLAALSPNRMATQLSFRKKPAAFKSLKTEVDASSAQTRNSRRELLDRAAAILARSDVAKADLVALAKEFQFTPSMLSRSRAQLTEALESALRNEEAHDAIARLASKPRGYGPGSH